MMCKVCVLSLFAALAVPSFALEWKEFLDAKSMLFTDQFAKSISEQTEAEKVAATQKLHDALKSNEVEIRRRAALTLHALGSKAGVPVMIADLSTATGSDRNNVIVALRILKDERSIPALRGALKDKSPYIRGIALGALAELKAAQAFDDIVALAKDKEVEETGKLNCMRMYPAHMASYALGALGDPRAIPVLIEQLNDEELRHPALQALEILTKQGLGNDADKWRAWWKSQKN